MLHACLAQRKRRFFFHLTFLSHSIVTFPSLHVHCYNITQPPDVLNIRLKTLNLFSFASVDLAYYEEQRLTVEENIR